MRTEKPLADPEDTPTSAASRSGLPLRSISWALALKLCALIFMFWFFFRPADRPVIDAEVVGDNMFDRGFVGDDLSQNPDKSGASAASPSPALPNDTTPAPNKDLSQ
ncbi:cytochrome oxidase putative small subunit CydP [Rhodovibrionaceae bacterium A322]